MLMQEISANCFRTDLEPAFGLPTKGSDRTIIKSWIGGRCSFIVQELGDHSVKMCLVLGGHSSQNNVRHTVTAYISIDVVGNTIVIPDRRYNCITGGAIITDQKDSSWCRIPTGTWIHDAVNIAFDRCRGVATYFRNCFDHSGNSLFISEYFDRICPGQKDGIIRTDDEIFGAFSGTVSHTVINHRK